MASTSVTPKAAHHDVAKDHVPPVTDEDPPVPEDEDIPSSGAAGPAHVPWWIRACPFFYGYVVAAAATLVMVFSGPGQTAVIGTTITKIVGEFGIGRTTVSGLYLLGTLTSACVLPFLGKFLDNFGPRRTFVCVVIGLVFSCMLYAMCSPALLLGTDGSPVGDLADEVGGAVGALFGHTDRDADANKPADSPPSTSGLHPQPEPSKAHHRTKSDAERYHWHPTTGNMAPHFASKIAKAGKLAHGGAKYGDKAVGHRGKHTDAPPPIYTPDAEKGLLADGWDSRRELAMTQHLGAGADAGALAGGTSEFERDLHDLTLTEFGFFLAFCLLRIFGQGGMMLVSTNAINLWFVDHRAQVMGFASLVTAFCLSGIFTSTVKKMVELGDKTGRWTWHSVYVFLAFLELCVVFPLGFLFLANKPETYGVLPDGKGFVDTRAKQLSARKRAQKVKSKAGIGGRRDRKAGRYAQVAEPEAIGAGAPAVAAGMSVANAAADADAPGSSDDAGSAVASNAVSAPTTTTETELMGAGARSESDIEDIESQEVFAEEAVQAEDEAEAEPAFTLKEALRTWRFWFFLLGICWNAGLFTALMFHLDSILGPVETNLVYFYLTNATVSALGSFTTGTLLTKKYVSPPAVIAFLCLGQTGAFFTLGEGLRHFVVNNGELVVGAKHVEVARDRDTQVQMWLVAIAVFQGAVCGAAVCLANSVFAIVFGRTHNGKIQGVSHSGIVVSTAIGPAFVSVVHDWCMRSSSAAQSAAQSGGGGTHVPRGVSEDAGISDQKMESSAYISTFEYSSMLPFAYGVIALFVPR